MQKIKKFIKDELSGWKAWEVIWLGVALISITVLGLIGHDTAMGIVSSTTGMAYSVVSGKGKLSAYFFGLINAVLYAIIAYQAAYYAETALNIYYVPMLIVGFFTWAKNMNGTTKEVNKRRMTWRTRTVTAAVIAAGTVVCGFVLRAVGDAMPFVDAFTTVASIVTMVVSVRMFVEQWWLWLIIDAVTVYLWVVAFLGGNDSVATLVMWALYIVNAIVMLVKWEREIRANEKGLCRNEQLSQIDGATKS